MTRLPVQSWESSSSWMHLPVPNVAAPLDLARLSDSEPRSRLATRQRAASEPTERAKQVPDDASTVVKSRCPLAPEFLDRRGNAADGPERPRVAQPPRLGGRDDSGTARMTKADIPDEESADTIAPACENTVPTRRENTVPTRRRNPPSAWPATFQRSPRHRRFVPGSDAMPSVTRTGLSQRRTCLSCHSRTDGRN